VIRRLKIGINATFLNEKPTGVGVFTKEVCQRLCALNKDTRIFTSVPIEPLREPCIQRTPEFVKGSLHIRNNFNRFIYTNTVLPLVTKKMGIDILFCPIVEYPFIPLSPLIVMVHDLHPMYFPAEFGLSAQHFKFSLRLLPMLVRRIIVPSHFVKGELLKAISIESERVDVIPPGYDAARFKPMSDSMKMDFLETRGIKRPFVLFVGNLFPYKNVKVLIEAFTAIKDRIPHSLVIIGRKELSAEPLGEDRRIHYLDYIRNHELPAFYSCADLLVHPSLIEGFGMTILEAMACGTPVVSSDRGSLPEAAGEAGILFDPEDSGKLSEIILEVIHNEKLRRDMVERGFGNARKYSWEKTAEGILEACEKALKNKR
jgi:glycosyltransferase involved in cell wall biosynthesis